MLYRIRMTITLRGPSMVETSLPAPEASESDGVIAAFLQSGHPSIDTLQEHPWPEQAQDETSR